MARLAKPIEEAFDGIALQAERYVFSSCSEYVSQALPGRLGAAVGFSRAHADNASR